MVCGLFLNEVVEKKPTMVLELSFQLVLSCLEGKKQKEMSGLPQCEPRKTAD